MTGKEVKKEKYMEEKTVASGRRNGALSMIKLIAAAAIVLAHVPFPGTLGKIWDVLVRFTVPFFCGVSGYYSFRVGVPRLQRQLKKIVNLTILASALFFAWDVIYRFVIRRKGLSKYLSDLLDVEVLARFVYIGENPFAGHLWYLSAMILIYIILILYSQFWDTPDKINYTPLYCVSTAGYLIQIALSIKFESMEMQTNYLLYRYCLMNALPAFCIGLFLRQYRARIVNNYGFTHGKAVRMIALGIALTMLQWYGIGTMSFPIGMIPVVIAIMLWATEERDLKPQSPSMKAFYICVEMCSTVVYVIHPLINRIIHNNSRMVPFFAQIRSRDYLYPLIILALSMLVGIVVSILMYAIRKNRSARSACS